MDAHENTTAPKSLPDSADASKKGADGAVRWRIRPSWIGASGTIYYALQERRWWGWRTWHNQYVYEAACAALKQLESTGSNTEVGA